MSRKSSTDESAHALDGEAVLLAGLRAGDDGAFEQLVRRYGGRMLAVARRILKSEEDAQDALQEAFLAAFRSLEGFKEDARLSTWLHRIVVNSALMKQRRRARKPEDSIEDLLPRFLEDGHQANPTVAWKESVDDALERREIRELVRQSIDRLPEIYRTALVLRDIEDLDTEETGRLLGVSPNVVKIRLHRARQALRTLLDPQLRGGKA